jgi:hypothetical protein
MTLDDDSEIVEKTTEENVKQKRQILSSPFFLTLLGIAVGGLISWGVSSMYYERASEDLTKEAQELRRMNTILMSTLENAGFVKYECDENGNIIGLQFRPSTGGGGIGGGSADYSFGRARSPENSK